MPTRSLPVPDALIGQRVDSALARALGLSRTQTAEIAETGGVLLDGRRVGKSERLPATGWLEVRLPDGTSPHAQVRPLVVPGMGIVYDDNDLVVVDKPAGIAAHPSLGWDGPDVLSALFGAGFRIATSGAPERQGIVQRLDVGTSGLMVVAKSELAYARLKRAFRSRQVAKVYHALAQGHLDPLAGTIDAPIGRHPAADWKFAVTSRGRHSVTHWQVLEMLPSACLCRVDLETGRTHQIRVHFAALRHPLVGDLTYGADPRQAERLGLVRQWLHATELGFTHPTTGDWIAFCSPYAADLEAALEVLRG